MGGKNYPHPLGLPIRRKCGSGRKSAERTSHATTTDRPHRGDLLSPDVVVAYGIEKNATDPGDGDPHATTLGNAPSGSKHKNGPKTLGGASLECFLRPSPVTTLPQPQPQPHRPRPLPRHQTKKNTHTPDCGHSAQCKLDRKSVYIHRRQQPPVAAERIGTRERRGCKPGATHTYGQLRRTPRHHRSSKRVKGFERVTAV